MRAWLILLGCALLIRPALAQPCVTMVFKSDHSVVLNGTVTDLASLPARLNMIAKRSPQPVLCLMAGPDSSSAEVQAAMGVIQKSGLIVNTSGVHTAN